MRFAWHAKARMGGGGRSEISRAKRGKLYTSNFQHPTSNISSPPYRAESG